MKAKVKKIKHGIIPGTVIPSSVFNNDFDGAVGKWAESVMQQNGHNVSEGIIDFPQYEKEMKTRKKSSTTPHTIGSMTIKNILITDWEDSNFCKKMQGHYKVTYDDVFQEVTNESILDWTNPDIQSKLKAGYEANKKRLEEGCRDKHIQETEWVIFDGYNDDNSYRMRIPDKAMKSLEGMAKSTTTFNKFFELTTV